MTKLGIHYPNARFRNMAAFAALPLGHVTLLHTERSHLEALRRQVGPNGTLLVRGYLSNWFETEPAIWADRIVEWATENREWTVDWTWANEQNLKGEGHPFAAGDGNGDYPPASMYRDIAEWNLAVIERLRDRAPWIRLHFPALSQGHSDDQDDGTGYVGFDILQAAVEACDVVDVHTYWEADIGHAGYDSPWFGRRYERVHALFPDKPLFISECAPHLPSSPNAPAQIRPWLDALPGYVIGTSFFIWDSNEANAPWTLCDKPQIIEVFKNYQGSAATPQPEPPAPGDSTMLIGEPLDPNLPELRIERYQGQEAHFKLVDWERTPDTGWSGAWVQVYDEQDRPMPGIAAIHFWPQPPTKDGEEPKIVEMKHNGAEFQPIAEFILNPAHAGFDGHGMGPHNFTVPPGDIVYGAGTRGNRHFQYRFVFKRVLAGTQPPDEPPPQPPGEPAGLDAAIGHAEAVVTYLKGLK